ncbi:MAG: ATP-binding protein [Rhodospirillales bacterium]|nr:ATP-binding protein [Rhodospirillales bacterium]
MAKEKSILLRDGFVQRHAEPKVIRALADTRVTAIVGPRQSGKTTLARRIADRDGRSFITLDDAQYRRFANHDPDGFMRGLEYAVIDEIQRAPDLILAIKKAVDEDPRPGRYLITGSADLFRGTLSPDSLAGRVEIVQLLPFAQSEIAGTPAIDFLDRAFAGDFPGTATIGLTEDLVERVISGGFPEALSRSNPGRRRSWLLAYVRSLAERDAVEIAAVGRPEMTSRLIESAAATAGQLTNASRLGMQLGVDSKTVARWITVLEQMFLVRRIRAWHRNNLKRLVKTPKLQFLDSGLLAALQRADAARLAVDRQTLGPLLECFVHAELAKVAALTDTPTSFYHFRDKDQMEVDFVAERPTGEIVGIAVKAAATVRPRDFRGLARLEKVAGEQFACGILLHDGDRIQRISASMFAMPVGMLWRPRSG